MTSDACRRFEARLQARLDARRPPADDADLAGHAAACPACAGRLRLATAWDEAFGRESHEDQDTAPGDVAAPAAFMADVLRRVRRDAGPVGRALAARPIEGTSDRRPGRRRAADRGTPGRGLALAGTIAAALAVAVLLLPTGSDRGTLDVALGPVPDGRHLIDPVAGGTATVAPAPSEATVAASLVDRPRVPGPTTVGRGVLAVADDGERPAADGGEMAGAAVGLSSSPMSLATQRLILSLIEGPPRLDLVDPRSADWVLTPFPGSLPTLDPTDWAVRHLARPFLPISRQLSDTWQLFRPGPSRPHGDDVPAASTLGGIDGVPV